MYGAYSYLIAGNLRHVLMLYEPSMPTVDRVSYVTFNKIQPCCKGCFISIKN